MAEGSPARTGVRPPPDWKAQFARARVAARPSAKIVDFVARAARAGAEAHFHDMGRVGHYMFRAAGRWNEFALTRSLALLPE